MHYMGVMLTGSQRVTLRKLKNGEIEDPKELKRARYSLRSYVSRTLRDIPELLEVMEVLGDDQMEFLAQKEEIKTEHLRAACQLSERLAQILDVLPVAPHDDPTVGEAVFGTAIIERSNRGLDLMTMYRTATADDIARVNELKDHIARLDHHINPYVRDSVVHDIEYFQRFRKYAETHGLSYGGHWHLVGRLRPDGSLDADLIENPPSLTESDFSRHINPPGLPPHRIEEEGTSLQPSEE
jgi:hypothetical protein